MTFKANVGKKSWSSTQNYLKGDLVRLCQGGLAHELHNLREIFLLLKDLLHLDENILIKRILYSWLSLIDALTYLCPKAHKLREVLLIIVVKGFHIL